MIWEDHVSADVAGLYEMHDYLHAAAILRSELPSEFLEVCEAMRTFRFSTEDVTAAGGNERTIPKLLSAQLRPKGRVEEKLTAQHVVDETVVSSDTHKVDYVKGRIAFDLEWNSKDKTFDRDLYALRTLFDYGKFSAAVLVTRSNRLDPRIDSLGEYVDKHGAKRKYKQKFERRQRIWANCCRGWNRGVTAAARYWSQGSRLGYCRMRSEGQHGAQDHSQFSRGRRSPGLYWATAVSHHPGRPAVEVHQSNRQDGS